MVQTGNLKHRDITNKGNLALSLDKNTAMFYSSVYVKLEKDKYRKILRPQLSDTGVGLPSQ